MFICHCEECNDETISFFTKERLQGGAPPHLRYACNEAVSQLKVGVQSGGKYS